jgi:hypothetical protein
MMLGDPAMAAPSKAYPNLRFGEDMQTMRDNGWTGANVVYAGHQGVWNGKAVSSTPSWGPYENLHPSLWQSAFSGDSWYNIGEDYRRCCTSISWIGEGLAARIMHAETLWDHDPFFEYVDRWMTENDAPNVAIIKSSTGLDYSADWEAEGQAWDTFIDEMWKAYRNNLPATDVGTSSLERGDFRLLLNYPNPFNPVTTIAYGVQKRKNVTLKVFDLLGREVATLVNEQKEPGLHAQPWNAVGLASGMYIAQLRAGTESRSIKLFLIK